MPAVGINLTKRPPGGWSSQRNWHAAADEFVYVLARALSQIEDDGTTPLPPSRKIPAMATT